MNTTESFLLGEYVAYKPDEHQAAWSTEPYVIDAVTIRTSRSRADYVSYTLLLVSNTNWAYSKSFVRPEQLRRWGDRAPREEAIP